MQKEKAIARRNRFAGKPFQLAFNTSFIGLHFPQKRLRVPHCNRC